MNKSGDKVKNGRYYIRISPDIGTLYEDMEACCSNAYGDEVCNFCLYLGPRFSIVIPGLMEWLRRYEDATDFSTCTTKEDFDWRSWHWEGLHFAKAIRDKLPRCYDLYYCPPYEDESGLIDKVLIDDSVDQLIAQMGTSSSFEGSECAYKDNLTISQRLDALGLTIVFRVGKLLHEERFPITSLKYLRSWLEDIIEDDSKRVHNLYNQMILSLFPQRVGIRKEMAQLWISEKMYENPEFQVYINKFEFVHQMYNVTLHTLEMAMNDTTNESTSSEERIAYSRAYEEFKSHLIEQHFATDNSTM